MRDKTKIALGVIVFLGLLGIPFVYNMATGKTGYQPEVVKPAGGGQCVEDAAFMKRYHMDLLNTWRDEYVREGKLYHELPGGRKVLKSLSKTCLDCHRNKSEFCDRCHDYAGVDPYCWDCHIVPEGSHR
jgi:hypothetical protein